MSNIVNVFIRRAATGMAALAFTAFAAGASAQGLAEGTNYVRLKNPVPVEPGKNIEVIEFFSYGCPHCGELEPNLPMKMHLVDWAGLSNPMAKVP